MKKHLIYLCLSLLLFACSNSNDDEPFVLNNISNFESSIQLLEISLSTSESVPIKYDNHELIQIEGEMYLRSQGGEYVTTSLLRKDVNNVFNFVGIACTSKLCSSSGECVPKADGKSCTDCSGGDCTKTVTGIGAF